MKLQLPHPAAVDLPADFPWHVPGRSARGLDLGDDHYLELSHGYEMAEDEAVGATVSHLKADGEWCQGWISFAEGFAPPTWTVESWDPLTCSPSLRCRCGDTGDIQAGRWVRAQEESRSA